MDEMRKVEYALSELGNSMLPIIDALAAFGKHYKRVVEARFSDFSVKHLPDARRLEWLESHYVGNTRQIAA